MAQQPAVPSREEQENHAASGVLKVLLLGGFFLIAYLLCLAIFPSAGFVPRLGMIATGLAGFVTFACFLFMSALDAKQKMKKATLMLAVIFIVFGVLGVALHL